MNVRFIYIACIFIFSLLQLISPMSVQADSSSVQSKPMISGTVERESLFPPETKKDQVILAVRQEISPVLLAFFFAFLVLLPVIKLVVTIVKHLKEKKE